MNILYNNNDFFEKVKDYISSNENVEEVLIYGFLDKELKNI